VALEIADRTELAILDRWLDRALTVTSVDELLPELIRRRRWRSALQWPVHDAECGS